jgi:hypothetical protein
MVRLFFKRDGNMNKKTIMTIAVGAIAIFAGNLLTAWWNKRSAA